MREAEDVLAPYLRSPPRRRARGRAPRRACSFRLFPRRAANVDLSRGSPLAGLLAANAISITGNRLTQLAIPWFVLQSTGSVGKTGLVGFFSLLPFVISSALGGVIVDRLGYRRASIVADLASGATVLRIPILYHTVGLPFAALLALVFARALLDAPGQTAREAMLPDLLEQAGMTLERGTSLFDGVSRGANMLGAPLAGVLIAVLGRDERARARRRDVRRLGAAHVRLRPARRAAATRRREAERYLPSCARATASSGGRRSSARSWSWCSSPTPSTPGWAAS